MHDSSSLKITIRPIAESTKRKTDVDLELLTAAKRGKPDSLVFTQHPVYWSSEKMVIIQVQNTLFRLHERHLGLHSPFFASLFAGNHPRQSEYLAHIDGQNVYRISSTSVEDFETLLSALDNMVYVNTIREPILMDISDIHVQKIYSFSTSIFHHRINPSGFHQSAIPFFSRICREIFPDHVAR